VPHGFLSSASYGFLRSSASYGYLSSASYGYLSIAYLAFLVVPRMAILVLPHMAILVLPHMANFKVLPLTGHLSNGMQILSRPVLGQCLYNPTSAAVWPPLFCINVVVDSCTFL
jgi:hypothetical protein